MESTDRQWTFKVLFIGPQETGKSSICAALAQKPQRATYISTIGVDFFQCLLQFDRNIVRLQLFDSAGQQRFYPPNPYRGQHTVVLVYAINDRTSFQQMEHQYQTATSHARNGVIFVLLGNKLDREKERQVTEQEAANFASQRNMIFKQVNATDSAKLEAVMTEVAKELIRIEGPIAQRRRQEMDARAEAIRSEQNSLWQLWPVILLVLVVGGAYLFSDL